MTFHFKRHGQTVDKSVLQHLVSSSAVKLENAGAESQGVEGLGGLHFLLSGIVVRLVANLQLFQYFDA